MKILDVINDMVTKIIICSSQGFAHNPEQIYAITDFGAASLHCLILDTETLDFLFYFTEAVV